MTHPLEGITVLDLTRLLPGATCTLLLVDMGADVIKIEDPNGGDYARWMGIREDGKSNIFAMNNRGKRSIILNLKDEHGQVVLKKLVEKADVLIESFRPGVMSRLNCDYEALKAINPKLIYCALSGWGQDGPYVNYPNHDINYVAVAGLTGSMQTPQVIGAQVADIGGAYNALSGILAALFRRERCGEGAFIDISMSESVLPFMLYTWVEAVTDNIPGGKGALSGGLACYQVYTTLDNKSVALGALEPKFWANFCNMVEHPELIDGYLEPQHQPALTATLETIFASKRAAEWDNLLRDAECCFSVVNAPAEAGKNVHYQARGALGQFEDGTPWLRSPFRLSESTPEVTNTIPGYGEHTYEVLSGFGYSADEITKLVDAGIVR